LISDIANRLSKIVGMDGADIVNDNAVVWPASTDEVAGILEAANEMRVMVKCAGSVAPDSLSDTAKCDGPTVLIERERLRGSWEYVREDLLLSVGAGVILREISSFLDSDDLTWPGMSGYGDEEQIASVLDSAPGQNTRKGRRIRRFLYGLIVVLPTGEIAHIGSRTVKSVAGYDLKALYLGSRSCFGIITECDLKLSSRQEVLIEPPDYSKMATMDFASDRGAPESGSQGISKTGGGVDTRPMIDVLSILKKKLDPNGILPTIEAAGIDESCR
jgi:FAD/FMN-containing dehydrogenase